MTTKKSETTTGGTDSANAQEKLNELYAAHQVHTLAHLIFQQIASGWGGGGPWAAPVAHATAAPMPGHSHVAAWPSGGGMAPQPGAGSPTGAPQPMFYWYP